jgi:succinyl-diaminopimelate desuccinylase
MLDIRADGVALTAALVDVESVSGDEKPLADLVEEALRAVGGLTVVRDGDAVIARTDLGRDRRVLLAGHLDTVPVAGNLPSRLDGDRLYGCGTSDMKSGVAVMLRLAATLAEPVYDLSYVFYDNEEVEAVKNGLNRITASHPEWLAADMAVVLEPTNGVVELGCQGSVRVRATVPGVRAHSARSWRGENAIHRAAPLLTRLSGYAARIVPIDGLTYREGMNATRIGGGVAGNVIPDECWVEINYRFAPDRTEEQALDHVREFLDGYALEVTDSSPAAPPGLSSPAVRAFVDTVGGTPIAKFGWNDVARFAQLGIPAVNLGPGDPNVAHSRGEYVEIARIAPVEDALRRYLTTGGVGG